MSSITEIARVVSLVCGYVWCVCVWYVRACVCMCVCVFLVGYVEERLWWPKIARKKEASSEEDREIRSSLLILDLKDGKL